MPVEIKCKSRLHTLRLRDDVFWRRTVCPRCKDAADPLRIRRLIARVSGHIRNRKRRFEIPDEIRFANLKWRIDRLAKAGWENQEKVQGQLILSPAAVANLSVEDSVKTLLDHIRVVAPSFSVPVRVPKINRARLASEAGQFAVSEGWVSMTLSEELITNRRALRSVLAHEVCHYVLNNSGIREADTVNNEKLTDLCMFVCGLGDLFLDGYKSELVAEEYRVGHRLGYLTDSEYQFARRYVMRLRKGDGLSLPTRIQELRGKIAARVGDSRVIERLLENERKRYPARNELEQHEAVLESVDKGRVS